MSKIFTRQEVSTRNAEKSAYVIIDSKVYDITNFASMHPGGEQLLMEYAGKEVTKEFYGFHRQEVLMKYKRLIIGSIVNETPKIVDNFNGELSKVPYSEPASEMGFHSPYYQESHHRYRLAVRKFLQNILVEHGLSSGGDYDMDSTLKVHCELGKAGILAGLIGPGPHLKQFPQLGSVDVDEFDAFHEMILQEEFVTQAFPASGFVSSVVSGLVIGLPPLIHFGNDHMRNVIVPQVLSGQKKIVLAISEPFAGSDVAQIKTTARKTADGKHYIVNGVKKWITGGPYTDYFTAAVRTGSGNGPDAISMLLIERSAGVETKPIKSSKGTDTAYVILENVMVPVENLLGNEGEGFKVIMFNFNHERWGMVVAAATMSRLVISECMKWANQREVFGKKLIEQPVIRFKLAKMVSETEAIYSWLESITYQMSKMSYKEQSIKLAGPIALAKFRATRVCHLVSDEACQIFGGRGITKTGMGRIIEEFQRVYKFQAILGGSEEILADLGIRQAMKGFPNAKL